MGWLDAHGGVGLSTKFTVANNAVNQHAANLDSAVAMLNGQAANFLNAIESLPAVWKGTSYSSWDQLTTQWHESMTQLNSALTDIKTRVGDAGSLYDRYEAQQADQLHSTMAGQAWDATKFRG